MLGSHNSLTSYPCVWYLKPFNVFSKCQSKWLSEQLEAGVRYFDLRIKMKPNGEYCFAHGLASYRSPSLNFILMLLQSYSQRHDVDIYFRVMLEYNKKPKRSDEILTRFTSLASGLKNLAPKLYFCGAYQKWDYKEVVQGDVHLNIAHKYSSVLGWKRFIHCIPYLYAKKHNNQFKEEFKEILDGENEVLMLDFV